MSTDRQSLPETLRELILTQRLESAVFSGPVASGPGSIRRVDVRPVGIRGALQYQLTASSDTQQFHTNYPPDAAIGEIHRLIAGVFRNVHASSGDCQYEARCSRRGKWFLKVRRSQVSPAADAGNTDEQPASGEEALARRSRAPTLPVHNQQRQLLIPDGVPCPFLIRTGVMRDDGHVRADQRRKFRQINRYLEFIRDVLPALPTDRTLQVVDFGCGKSYLTFAVHYYLTEIERRDCCIVGLDRRTDVIETCREIGESLQLQGLSFAEGAIDGFATATPVDLVISLHACDTATDDALAQAVAWECPVVLAVPCCHQELLNHLPATALPPVTSHGIGRERLATLTTDSLRTSLMEAAGYQAALMEFIETEHTPRNLLIRCLRRTHKSGVDSARRQALHDVHSVSRLLQIPPLTLERRLTCMHAIPEADRAPADDSGRTLVDAVDSWERTQGPCSAS